MATLSVSGGSNISNNTEFPNSRDIGSVRERELPVFDRSTFSHDNTVKTETIFGGVFSGLDKSVRSWTPDKKGPIPLHFTVKFFEENSSSIIEGTSETITKVRSVVFWYFNNGSSGFAPFFKDGEVPTKSDGTFIHNVGHGSVESNGSVGSRGVSSGWNTGSRWIGTGVVDEGTVVRQDRSTEKFVVTSDVGVVGSPDGGTEDRNNEVFGGRTKSDFDRGGINSTRGDFVRVSGTSVVTGPDLTDRVGSKSHRDESVFEFGVSTGIGFEGVIELWFEGESTLSTSGEWFESDSANFEVHSSGVDVLLHSEGNGGTRIVGIDTFSRGNSISGSTSRCSSTGRVTDPTGTSREVGSSGSSDNVGSLGIGPVSNGQSNITSTTDGTVSTDAHSKSWVGKINRDIFEV